jgi:hypothetical protein
VPQLAVQLSYAVSSPDGDLTIPILSIILSLLSLVWRVLRKLLIAMTARLHTLGLRSTRGVSLPTLRLRAVSNLEARAEDQSSDQRYEGGERRAVHRGDGLSPTSQRSEEEPGQAGSPGEEPTAPSAAESIAEPTSREPTAVDGAADSEAESEAAESKAGAAPAAKPSNRSGILESRVVGGHGGILTAAAGVRTTAAAARDAAVSTFNALGEASL